MSSDPDEALARLLREAGPRREAPADVEVRVRNAVRERWTAKVRERRRGGRAQIFVAAAALVAGLGVLYVARSPEVVSVGAIESVRRTSPGHAPGDPVLTGAAVETGGGERLAIRLLSGLALRVDERSRLTFRSPTEVVLTRGALYVDAVPGSGRFSIDTSHGEVEHVGTRYQVRTGTNALEIHVREGSVILRGFGESRRLGAGTAATFFGESWTLSNEAPFSPVWDWVAEAAPPFSLEDDSLAAVLRWVCGERGLRLRFASVDLARVADEVRVTGSLEGMTPSEVLEAVLPASAMDYRVEGGVIEVLDASQ